MTLRNILFMRRVKRDCASTLARELALVGVEKRKASVHAVARRIREEIGLPPSPVFRA